MPIGLNEKHPSPAYHAGRFLALCQHAQHLAASDLNSTFVDRFFGAASTSPMSVLPRVYRTAVHRLRQIDDWILRRDVEAALIELNQRFESSWPRRLDMQEQANFQLGFFHQSAALPSSDRRARVLTDRGESVKSLGERLIANLLFAMPSEEARGYRYEHQLPLPEFEDGSKTMTPDFVVESADASPRFLYIEYTGMAGDPGYDRTWRWKSARYRELGRTIEDCMTDGEFNGRHTLMQVIPSDRYVIEQFEVRLNAAVTAFLGGTTPELQEAWRSGVAPQETPW